MRREYFRIPPEVRKDSNMQHILVHDNLVVFWIFIQFLLRQSNYVQYRSAYLQVVNLNASAKIYRGLWFSYFCRHLRTFCECHYIHIWEICIPPRSVQAKQILIGRFVECQSIKKVGGRRSVEELYQALFSFRPSRRNVSPSGTKIEPDRRLYRFRIRVSSKSALLFVLEKSICMYTWYETMKGDLAVMAWLHARAWIHIRSAAILCYAHYLFI